MTFSSTPELLFERRGAVQWVLFNRPLAHHAMTDAMEHDLVAFCAAVADMPDVKAIVFSGAPAPRPAFMAGADFASLQAATTVEQFVALERSSETLLAAIEALRIPTVAAIAGACVGGGALLAACCDVRLAAPSTKFGFPIARTVGNCLSVRNYARLTDLVGVAMTRDMVFSARLADAQALAGVHAVREVVADDALHARAQEVAEHLSTLAPLTLWATKQALLRLRDRTVDGTPDDDLLYACYQSADFQEGVAAFLDKRKPVWQGR